MSRLSNIKEEGDEEQKKVDVKVPPEIHAKLGSIVDKVKFKEIMQRLNTGQQTGLSQTPAYIF